VNEPIGERFAAYLRERVQGATQVEVAEVQRIFGGASRETYRLRARWTEGGSPREQRMILRRDPTGSLIDTERELEFRAYAAFEKVPGVPVPRALYLELDERWLGRPFMVMEEVVGCQVGSPFALDPFGERREEIGRQFWQILGRIAAADPSALGLVGRFEAPALDRCWERELGFWEAEIDRDELTPQPIVRAAIRRLRRRPPPPAQRLCMVHGDYRTGNFLYDGDGTIRAILDWEMAHLGDPLEDIAWAATRLWAWPDGARPGRMLERTDAFGTWRSTSGLEIDPEALAWWELFACVKGLAIWISSAKEYTDGSNKDPVLAFSGWRCTDLHNLAVVDLMAPKLEALP
jgi:aminoglycoside phosphotransferase (APT) family kinase protein